MEALDASYGYNESDALYMSMVYPSPSYPYIIMAVDDVPAMDMSASIVTVSATSDRIKDVSVE